MGVLNRDLLGSYLIKLAKTKRGREMSVEQGVELYREEQHKIAAIPDQSKKKWKATCPSCGSSFFARVGAARAMVRLEIQYSKEGYPYLYRRTDNRRVYLGRADKLLQDPRQIPDFDKEMPRRWFNLGQVQWQSGILYKDGPSGRPRKVGWHGHKATTGRKGSKRRPAPG
jgi:alpha-D-ribose 1-methylphosphonate 5-triphosphate synthase subunit PhnG